MEPVEVADDDADLDDRAELLWRWGVRALYTLAIAANAWQLWRAWADSPEYEIQKRQLQDRLAPVIEPLRRRREWVRSRNRMLWDAHSTVWWPDRTTPREDDGDRSAP